MASGWNLGCGYQEVGAVKMYRCGWWVVLEGGRARAKGLGLALASEADFEFLPSTFSIAVDASGGMLRCLLELRITLILSLAQR